MKSLGVKQGLEELGRVDTRQGSGRAEEGVAEERMRGDTVAPIKLALNKIGIIGVMRGVWGECEVGERLKGLVGDMDEVFEGGKGRRQVEGRILRLGM